MGSLACARLSLTIVMADSEQEPLLAPPVNSTRAGRARPRGCYYYCVLALAFSTFVIVFVWVMARNRHRSAPYPTLSVAGRDGTIVDLGYAKFRGVHGLLTGRESFLGIPYAAPREHARSSHFGPLQTYTSLPGPLVSHSHPLASV